MKQTPTLLDQLDELNSRVGDMADIMEAAEPFYKYSEFLQTRHTESNVICDINAYKNFTSIDPSGIITTAESLLQIRYTDKNKNRSHTTDDTMQMNII
jgi:hypothetical protein